MLLVTYAGLTANLAHVAYIHLKADDTDTDAPQDARREAKPVRVLLALTTGDSVIAARDLPPAGGRFVARSYHGCLGTGSFPGGCARSD